MDRISRSIQELYVLLYSKNISAKEEMEINSEIQMLKGIYADMVKQKEQADRERHMGVSQVQSYFS
jgi:hypothetical protein